MEIFAVNLKKERELNDLTQEAMAEELGIPLQTYRNYESLSPRKHCEPDMKTLVKISEILNVSTDHLLGKS